MGWLSLGLSPLALSALSICIAWSTALAAFDSPDVVVLVVGDVVVVVSVVVVVLVFVEFVVGVLVVLVVFVVVDSCGSSGSFSFMCARIWCLLPMSMTSWCHTSTFCANLQVSV